MRFLSLLIGALLMSQYPAQAESTPDPKGSGWRLVIHGGAGVIERDRLTPEQDRDIRAALDLALRTGAEILERGGSALDAVEATARVLEDDPNFNSGRDWIRP
jgi:beta-aspartyl-peptidase (threonine type)